MGLCLFYTLIVHASTISVYLYRHGTSVQHVVTYVNINSTLMYLPFIFFLTRPNKKILRFPVICHEKKRG